MKPNVTKVTDVIFIIVTFKFYTFRGLGKVGVSTHEYFNLECKFKNNPAFANIDFAVVFQMVFKTKTLISNLNIIKWP